MVLAAGFGTRLRPLTDGLPKALVPVGDRPALAHALDRLLGAGAKPIVVNAHHRAAELRRYVETFAGVRVSEEPELLGTAGGVARANVLLGSGDVFIWNADILVDVDPAEIARAHAEAVATDPTTEATLVVKPRPKNEGPIGLNDAGTIVRLRDERVAEETQGGDFLGIHVLTPFSRTRLPPLGCLVGDHYLPALRRGTRLRGFLSEAPWFDIGSLGRYVDANVAWLAARGRTSWVDEGATVSGRVLLKDVVVGKGASVHGAGVLERCVVWPTAHVTAPLANAVVTPGAIVRVPV
jgi:mannose-1-phosphate guanylyltransferase